MLEDEGTVERIVKETVGSNHYTAMRFGYGVNERTVTHVLGEKWNGGGGNYTVTFARQFRYDGARQRYLNRELDPNDFDVVLSDAWSDYDGTSIYADWGFDGFDVLEERRSYMPGLAMTDQLAGGGAANTTYLHTSALGSTMATSTWAGTGTFDTAYTAFGEKVMGPDQRYGFAGEWGYQSHEDFDYMHLGARYYNPATGRFLQRDPFGIAGGVNVYVYVRNNPLSHIDPSGLGKKWDWIKDKVKKGWEVLKKLPPYILPSSPVPADVAPDLACIYMFGAYREHIEDTHDDNLSDENCPTCKRLDPNKKPKPNPKPKPKPKPKQKPKK